MDPSAFDPAVFLDATTTEAATRRPPLPVENPATDDHLYIGVLGEPKIRTWQGKKDPTKSGLALDVPIAIDVPGQLQDQLKLQPQVTLTTGGFVDVNDSGMLDWAPGKNGAARKLRDATGTNVPGQAFNFRMLQGKVVKVKIDHELYNNEVVDKVGNVFKA